MRGSPLESALAFHEDRFPGEVAELKRLVRIPSVSADGFPEVEVARSAEAVAELLRRRGFSRVEVLAHDGAHPYVLAEHVEDPALPTVLLYAHHDVQPPGEVRAWRSPPFEPVERDGRLFGRGAADDKAAVVVHAAAVEAWLRGAGGLPVNVKLLVEGEEETGSRHLAALLRRHGAELDASALVLADAGNVDVGLPCLTVSLRGLVAVEVEIRAFEQSLHSGAFGGPVPDPAMALSKMLASLVGEDGRIAVPGLEPSFPPLATARREALGALGIGAAEFGQLARLRPGVRVFGHGHPLELCWWQPALAVNAIQASSRRAARDVINGAAWAQVEVRIVPGQDAGEVRDALVAALRRAAPWGVEVELRTLELVKPWATDLAHPAFGAAFRALERGFGRRAAAIGCGGSIGFVEPFAAAFPDTPALLVGVEDPLSNPHSENESVDLGSVRRALRAEIHLLAELADAL